MNEIAVVERATNWRRLKALVLDSVSSPITGQFEDLVLAGVIDPTKVTRTALQNAASIASLMLTTEALICGMVEESESDT